ncbi:hypothetical protein CPU09_13855 [Mammaliicoccus sciuri]|nr:hypothetical protein CPU09_13855 [Mammaliicoccus sciuri]
MYKKLVFIIFILLLFIIVYIYIQNRNNLNGVWYANTPTKYEVLEFKNGYVYMYNYPEKNLIFSGKIKRKSDSYIIKGQDVEGKVQKYLVEYNQKQNFVFFNNVKYHN